MISIVVPAYNAAGVIGRCIDTVLRQTYPDFELLIIDDGSTDETAEIAAAKAAQDARIHLIRQENAGVSSARNTGIAAASGELLCFIDSDDTVSANYLETLHTLYSPGVLPVIDVVRSDRNGSALSPMPETFMLDGDWVDSYFCGQLRYGIAFSVWNKLFSLQTLRREHIAFLPELSIGEDMLFVFQYLHHCRSIRFSKDASYYYTIVPGSAMLSSRDYTQPYEQTFGVMSEKGRFPLPITGHYPDGHLTRVLSLLPIRLLSTETMQNSKNGGANFVRQRYTVTPLLRKNHLVINEEFCILPCTLRTRLQYMCFSDC